MKEITYNDGNLVGRNGYWTQAWGELSITLTHPNGMNFQVQMPGTTEIPETGWSDRVMRVRNPINNSGIELHPGWFIRFLDGDGKEKVITCVERGGFYIPQVYLADAPIVSK
ncbi:hypothetical protein ACFLY5_00155 [Patescibacteria group bacterium]